MERKHTHFFIYVISERWYHLGRQVNKMIIRNGLIFCEDGVFRQGNIYIEKEQITEIRLAEGFDASGASETAEVLDAQGLYVIPGLVDIHLHGCAGYDFCDATPEAFKTIAEHEVENGVTSIVPATMTLSKERLTQIAEAAGKYMSADSSVIKGITMEGPFISEEKKGAQDAQYIASPDKELLDELQKLSQGRIRQVTVAPEVDGAAEFIEKVSGDMVVSVAHTAADYQQTKTAFEVGANHVTHLFNAMPPLNHREPGVIGAALDYKNVFVELICDGEHVHPAVVRAAFQMFGADCICMISDSMRATGMPDGEYSLGGQPVWVKDGRAVLENGHLAASVCTLYDCLRKVVLEMGVPLEEAVKACTITPAKSLNLHGECGCLGVGYSADMLLLDADLKKKYVIKSGKLRKC